MAKHKIHVYPKLDEEEPPRVSPETETLQKLDDLFREEHGNINNIDSINKLALIFKDYLQLRLMENGL